MLLFLGRRAGNYQEIAVVQLFIERQATLLREENPLSCFSEFSPCLCLSRTWLDKTIMFDIETSMFTHLKGFCENETAFLPPDAGRGSAVTPQTRAMPPYRR